MKRNIKKSYFKIYQSKFYMNLPRVTLIWETMRHTKSMQVTASVFSAHHQQLQEQFIGIPVAKIWALVPANLERKLCLRQGLFPLWHHHHEQHQLSLLQNGIGKHCFITCHFRWMKSFLDCGK